MEDYNSLNEDQKDVLKEIGNIGGGNAATALSSILSGRVDMSVPSLNIIGADEIANLLGGPEKEVAGILVKMTDDIKGMLLFLLDKKFTHLLINYLLGKDIDGFESINEMDLSALSEIGNILAGSYVNAICTLTGLKISLLPPSVAVDMVGAILSYPAAVFGEMGDKVLYISDDFICGENSVKSHMLIMPEIDSLEKMLTCLGVA